MINYEKKRKIPLTKEEKKPYKNQEAYIPYMSKRVLLW